MPAVCNQLRPWHGIASGAGASKSRRLRCIGLAVGLALLLSPIGCTRAYYRKQADAEVKCLINEKSNDPRWELPYYTIKQDPRSRYFDPTSADCPPMPIDDPVSHGYMHCVDGKKGFRCWHANGDRNFLENPRWRQLLEDYTELNSKGEVKLPLESAVRLGVLHSSDYRAQIETLYLSALDVSTERFRFDTQFFGNNTTVFNHSGQDRSGTELNTLTNTTSLQARKHFATGADLLVGFANSFVWQFAGPDTNTSTSLLNFSLVQPLLRAGGRAVALEQLTIVERSLLANLRAFQRYRQGFYTGIAVGDASNVAGAQRRGGFFGGTGLTGFTGQGSGGFGEVGNATNFGRGGFGGGAGGAAGGAAGFAGGGAGTVGGFVGLLQQLQQVRNTQDSLNAQVRTLGLLEANLDAGLIDIAQVDQFRQNIQTERANLLQARNALTNSLETFKTGNIGLPPDLPVELDDTMIRQFRLIDPATTRVQNLIDDFISVVGDLPVEPTEAELREALEVLAGLRERLAERFKTVEQDLANLETASAGRAKTMSPKDVKRFAEERQLLAQSRSDIEARFAQTLATLESLQAGLGPENRAETADRLVSLASSLSGESQELSLVQARSRLESVTIDPIKLQYDRALDIARANRLDWMNNRAALVDTWRLIEFNANALKANLDITFSGDVANRGDNPFNFAGTNGTLRAQLRFDAPFTRLLERNNYRQVLINYQQDRRRLIQYQDGVNQTLRRTLRQLDQLAQNLEIQRRAVVIAVRRVDQTREVLNQPPAVVAPGAAASQLGPTAAQNLLTALSDLRNSQNNFMSVWLNHYAARMVLTRELGIMELDENGLWVDKPIDEAASLREQDCPLPPSVPQEWLADAGLGGHPLNQIPGGEVTNEDDDEQAPPKTKPKVPAENRQPSKADIEREAAAELKNNPALQDESHAGE